MSMPPPQQPRSTGVVVGLAALGVFAYVVFNVVVGFIAVSLATPAVLGVAAGFLFLGAIGGGVGLLLVRTPWAKGLGLGLMIGWALVSIVSAGWCTGLNPGLYA
ncbi:hypothetical protein OUY22_00430 [Nonomuraea sp. MCN248]|uniref:Uncharacterized protein n=1 Tax=Nonomuraea corallina TaxID=2989783 RepID=A0ABT4S3U0_9ACTN|nr:hypothetical protein [Nonomuraea corallina]MDA0631867.1 hypothetical protein [Nonomuraea corallina]